MTTAGSEASPKVKNRRGWKLVVKGTVTVVLLTLILWQVDWNEFVRTFLEARLSLIGAVVALMMLSVTISAYKWQQLLAIHDLRYGLGELHRWYFIAVFLNNFLPTSIGGDGYRVMKTFHNERSGTAAVIAVTMERVSGILVLLGMAYLASLVLWVREGHPIAGAIVSVGTVGIIGAGIGFGILILGGRMDRLVEHPRCPRVLRTVWEHFGDFSRHPRRSAWAVGGISLGFHLHTLFFYWLLLLALGHAAEPLSLLVILAIVAVASVLPISLNGVGVIEGSFVYTAMQFGIGYEVALSAILMIRVIKLLQSGVGAILYLRGDRGPKLSEAVSVSPGT